MSSIDKLEAVHSRLMHYHPAITRMLDRCHVSQQQGNLSRAFRQYAAALRLQHWAFHPADNSAIPPGTI